MSYLLGVDTSSGRAVIPKELDWMEYSSSLAIGSELLYLYPYVETIV